MRRILAFTFALTTHVLGGQIAHAQLVSMEWEHISFIDIEWSADPENGNCSSRVWQFDNPRIANPISGNEVFTTPIRDELGCGTLTNSNGIIEDPVEDAGSRATTWTEVSSFPNSNRVSMDTTYRRTPTSWRRTGVRNDVYTAGRLDLTTDIVNAFGMKTRTIFVAELDHLNEDPLLQKEGYFPILRIEVDVSQRNIETNELESPSGSLEVFDHTIGELLYSKDFSEGLEESVDIRFDDRMGHEILVEFAAAANALDEGRGRKRLQSSVETAVGILFVPEPCSFSLFSFAPAIFLRRRRLPRKRGRRCV